MWIGVDYFNGPVPPDALPMRVMVTGSRLFSTPDALYGAMAAVTSRAHSAVVVHGRCDPRHPWGDRERVPWNRAMLMSPGEQRLLLGADWHAHLFAQSRRWPEDPRPAPWRAHGRKAGFMRNADMVRDGAHVLVAALQEGDECKGTRMCAALAAKAGIRVVWVPRTTNP